MSMRKIIGHLSHRLFNTVDLAAVVAGVGLVVCGYVAAGILTPIVGLVLSASLEEIDRRSKP